jgi:N-acetylglutamate synthase-like GNAT family acetyltransferase
MQIVEEKKRVRLSKSARKRRGSLNIVDTPCHVRVATRDDLFGILALARIVHEENGLFDFNERKVAEAVWPTLTQANGIIGVIGERDKLEGVVMLSVASYWYSDHQFLEEKCVFVHPDYRRAKHSRVQKLIQFAKQVATEMEMPLMIGILSNQRTNAKVQLYEQHFGKPAGAFFLWGAKTGQCDPDLGD